MGRELEAVDAFRIEAPKKRSDEFRVVSGDCPPLMRDRVRSILASARKPRFEFTGEVLPFLARGYDLSRKEALFSTGTVLFLANLIVAALTVWSFFGLPGSSVPLWLGAVLVTGVLGNAFIGIWASLSNRACREERRLQLEWYAIKDPQISESMRNAWREAVSTMKEIDTLGIASFREQGEAILARLYSTVEQGCALREEFGRDTKIPMVLSTAAKLEEEATGIVAELLNVADLAAREKLVSTVPVLQEWKPTNGTAEKMHEPEGDTLR